MNLFADAYAWIFSPDRLTGSLPLPEAIAQHLAFTFGSVLVAALIAIPAGWAIGHTGKGHGREADEQFLAHVVPSCCGLQGDPAMGRTFFGSCPGGALRTTG